MMTILDRYILKSFIFSYLVCLLSLLALFTIMDFFQQVDDFLEPGITNQDPLRLFANYYLSRYLMVFGEINPFVLLMGAMFTVSWLDRYNELTAMKASGVSAYRCLRPVLLASLVIIAGQVVIQEWVLPGYGRVIEDNVRQLRQGHGRRQAPLNAMLVDRNGFRFNPQYFGPGPTLSQVYLDRCFATSNFKQLELTAIRGIWSEHEGQAGWRFSEGIIAAYDPEDPQAKAREEPLPATESELLLVISPSGYRRRAVPAGLGGAFLPTNLSPRKIEEARWRATSLLSLAELKSRCAETPQDLALRVQVHVRVTAPLKTIILVLLGLPFVLAGRSGGFFLTSALCLGICIIFLSVNMLGTFLGESGLLPPLAAVWLPHLLFGPVAVFRFTRLPT